MSLLLYLAVLLVSASSVLFGLGWLGAPEPHYNAPPVQVASQAPVKPAPAVKGAPPTVFSPVTPAAPIPPQTAAAEPAVAPVPSPRAPSAAAAANAGGADQADAARNAGAVATAATAPLPACDIQACTVAYHSFRAADCTYQPNDGPRRLCKKGTPPREAQPAAASRADDAHAQATPAQAPSCNIAACAAAYHTFDATDCTYQPRDGPRRLCAK